MVLLGSNVQSTVLDRKEANSDSGHELESGGNGVEHVWLLFRLVDGNHFGAHTFQPSASLESAWSHRNGGLVNPYVSPDLGAESLLGIRPDVSISCRLSS